VHALAQLIRHFDSLFDAVDAQGRPTWIGASTKVDEFCDYIPGTARPKLYAEPFWSLEETEGVMAAFSVSESGRPVLMAAVPFNGPARVRCAGRERRQGARRAARTRSQRRPLNPFLEGTMPSSTDIPLITSDMISFVTQETGASAVRARGALKAVGGHVDQAVELLRKIERSRAGKPPYGTELSPALGERPGFAEGYRTLSARWSSAGSSARCVKRGASRRCSSLNSPRSTRATSPLRGRQVGQEGISYEMLDRILPVLGYRLEHQIVPTRDAPLARPGRAWPCT
jgi:hypothetical protein